jgi:uncharacterized glyoxalase superfamily protein PhnB
MAAQPRFDAIAPQFTVPDVRQTAEYYRDVFGFRIDGYWDGDEAHQSADRPALFAIVSRDQVQVFFNRASAAATRTGRADGAYDAYLRIVGVDTLASEFRARGAEIVEGPEDRTYGQRELVVRDCNGLILAFGEDISARAT